MNIFLNKYVVFCPLNLFLNKNVVFCPLILLLPMLLPPPSLLLLHQLGAGARRLLSAHRQHCSSAHRHVQ
jgi:hypothetical protein